MRPLYIDGKYRKRGEMVFYGRTVFAISRVAIQHGRANDTNRVRYNRPLLDRALPRPRRASPRLLYEVDELVLFCCILPKT